jgi:TrmH family RNA methyltransferase
VRHTGSLIEEIVRYKQEGWNVIACESGVQGIPYTAIPSCGAYVCIVGNEVDGLDEDVVRAADVVAEIPMKGAKESLNVAVAGAVLLFHLRDKTQTSGF